MTCKTVHVKLGRSGILEAVLNTATTWEHATWTFPDSTVTSSSSISDKGSLVLQHSTTKLETTGQFGYAVEIQKQGSSLSCTGLLFVYGEF